MTPGNMLRQLLVREQPLVMPGVWDCVTAKLLEQLGFEALGVSGAGVSIARLGLPDLGFVGMTDLVDTVQAIVQNSRVPVCADADTGFGNSLNAIRTVRALTDAGAAAMHIEDQTFPKRCGHLDDKDVVSATEYLAKLSAVVNERPDPSFVIIARTDALAVEGLNSAVDRANRAIEVGADVVMIEAIETMEQMEQIGREVPGHKLYNLATGGRGPRLSVAEINRLGFDWIVMPGLAMAGVADGIRRAGSAALRDGDDKHVRALGFTPHDFFELAGLSEWKRLETTYPSD